MVISIENIYYLLCYAWDALDERDKVKVSVDQSPDLPDLFARILINGTRILLKRGLEKNYVEETIEFAGVKGKLEMGATLKSGVFRQLKTVCTIDEFSANTIGNRILLSTFYRLLALQGLDTRLKKQIKTLVWMFAGVEPVELSSRLFSQVNFHRNNRFYKFLIQVCRIIYENTMPSEEPGKWHFVDFLRDENKMNRLFESFLLNFYKREFPQWVVRSEQLRWQFETIDQISASFLPVMKTDISINTPSSRFIIDAKYYRESLATHYEKEKVKSVNLYQLFSYLINQRSDDPRSNSTTGILLYPTTRRELNLSYNYQSHNILIKTVNLDNHWKQIEHRLKEIVA